MLALPGHRRPHDVLGAVRQFDRRDPASWFGWFTDAERAAVARLWSVPGG
ncbi:hypothetical protein [Amycolatopsis sp. NPDC004079]